LDLTINTKFIWDQRFIQISLTLPSEGVIGQSIAITVDFQHCPNIVKPRKTAAEEQHYMSLVFS